MSNIYVTKTQFIEGTTKALDAQDKYNEKKYATKAEAAKLYKQKGSVNSFKDVPVTGNQDGDVYNMLTTYTTAVDMHGVHIKAGDDVVYISDDGNGNSGWNVLGGTTDLSDYYTKSQVDAQIGGAAGTISEYEIKAAVAAANPDIKINFYGDAAKAVTMINGDEDAVAGYTDLTAATLSTDKTKLILTATTIADGYPSEFVLNTAGTIATGTGTAKIITLNYTTNAVTVTDTPAA